MFYRILDKISEVLAAIGMASHDARRIYPSDWPRS